MKRPNKTASALVITLAMIVLITILVVGFVATARLDVVSARLHLDGVRADIYARTGEEVALARLKAATAVQRFWVSQPGRIIASPAGTNQPLAVVIDLSSGWLSNAVVTNVTVDLNPGLLENTNERLIFPPNAFGTNPPIMPVRWIYVRKDGTFETNAPPTYDAQNPVEGRFAFWVDDESTRINLNTAWTKATANTNTLSHPSRVSLNTLFGDSDIADITQYRLSQFFNSPEELGRAGTDVANTTSSNRFLFTHYNHAPELNMFGEPRIMLTTQIANLPKETREWLQGLPAAQRAVEGPKYFLDILATDNVDPGYYTNIVHTKYTGVVNNILNKLARTDWPIAPGKSFFGKYNYSVDPFHLAQAVMGIVDYVRSKESQLEVVASVRAVKPKQSPPYFQAGSSGDLMIGHTRRPLITEIGVWADKQSSSVTGNPRIDIKYFVEVYLPKGASRIDLTKCVFYMGMTFRKDNNAGNSIFNVPIKAGPPPVVVPDNEVYLDSSDPYLEEGNTRVIVAGRSVSFSGRPTWIGLRPGVSRVDSGKDAETVPILQNPGSPPPQNLIEYTFDPYTTNSTIPATSVGVVDPAANKSNDDWVQGPATWGAINPVGALPVVEPQRDEDSGGNLFVDGAQMPPPKGHPRNPYGIVESVGELGFIHTGISGGDGDSKGVPFRTFRVQPQKAGGAELPDWAILDLFCVPAHATANEMALLQPRPQSSGGRINLNNTVYPFADADNNPVLVRPDPLNALTAGAKKDWSAILSAAAASGIAGNIDRRDLAGSGSHPGRAFGNTNIYYSPWQIVEMADVAQGGEESEELLRQIGGLAAVRGNVFSIYAVGQSVRQAKDGKITVLGERRSHNMVERLTRVVGGNTNTVYQSVFSRELQP